MQHIDNNGLPDHHDRLMLKFKLQLCLSVRRPPIRGHQQLQAALVPDGHHPLVGGAGHARLDVVDEAKALQQEKHSRDERRGGQGRWRMSLLTMSGGGAE